MLYYIRSGPLPGVENDKDKTNKNTQNSSGKFTKCFICKSVYHWIKDCPHLEEVEHTYGIEDTNVALSVEKEEINIVLFGKGIKEHYNRTLLGETIGCGLLDSGCSKSVCGKDWLELYKETLSQEEEKLITYHTARVVLSLGLEEEMCSTPQHEEQKFQCTLEVNVSLKHTLLNVNFTYFSVKML